MGFSNQRGTTYRERRFTPGADWQRPGTTPRLAPSLKIDKIEAALRGSVLCREALLEKTGAGQTCRCGIAQLLARAGVTDVALQRLDNLGKGGDEGHIWFRFGTILEREYGFQSPRQVADVMNANDEAKDEDRADAVVRECKAINAEGRP